jgi:CubicO group peptidase (beta-lactamase class C family)
MKTFFAALSATALLAVATAPLAHAADEKAIAAMIDKSAQDAVAAGETPGLQVAVYKNGKPLLVKAYGSANLELNVPVKNESVFRIGSVTKQFTAVALLQLQEGGRLSLDDKLSKYFPDFPRAGDITLLQMLHHTSGLHNYTAEPDAFTKLAPLTHKTEEMLQSFTKMSTLLDFEPGTGWNYSNTAYYILGMVVEKVEQKPLATIFKDRFFTPLKMTRTALDDEAEIVPGRVEGYGATAPGKFTNATFISMTVPGGAGAMRSSANDLALWNAALFGGKLLKPASFQAMIAPGKLNDGQNSGAAMTKTAGGTLHGEYGLALFLDDVDGHQKIGHGGGINGFNSSLSEFPKDRITVAVIANTIGKDVGAGNIAKRIERIALDLPPAAK